LIVFSLLVSIPVSFAQSDFVAGEMNFIQEADWLSDKAIIQLNDPKLNLDDNVREEYGIDIWSDSDAGGIDLFLKETRSDSGIFEAKIFFATTGDSDNLEKILRVSYGDTITAEFEYDKLPNDHPRFNPDANDLAGWLIFSESNLSSQVQVIMSNSRIVDSNGNIVTSLNTGETVFFVSTIQSDVKRVYSTAYVVEIRINDIEVDKIWVHFSLLVDERHNQSLSWIPTKSGQYSAHITYENLEDNTILASDIIHFEVIGEEFEILTEAEKQDRKIAELEAEVDELRKQVRQLQSPRQYDSSSELETILPDWVRSVFIWYAQGLISEQELVKALEFLIAQGIIQV